MLRWWLGTGVLALLMLCSGLAAQPAGVPACDLDAKRSELAQGLVPNFRNCQIADASKLLAAAGYTPVRRIDETATGFPPDTITRQDRDGNEVYLWFASGKGYSPPPDIAPVRFSIEAPSSVAEGSSFTLTIRRDRFDRQAHELTLDYRPAGLLDNPTTSFTFEGKSNTATIPLNTTPGTPGDGDKTLQITLGAAAQKPQRVRVAVTDQQLVQSYAITSGNARRGDPITFVVTRTNVTDPVNPTYDLKQDGKPLPAGKPLAFGDGERSWTTQIGPSVYNLCGGAVSFVLLTPGGVVSNEAAFTRETPASCAAVAIETPEPTRHPTGDGPAPCVTDCTPPSPLWPWIAGAIAAIVAIFVGLYTWPWVPPAPIIRARWSIKRPLVSPFTLGEAALRWPGASAQVRVDPGDTHLPDPLPVEDNDHG